MRELEVSKIKNLEFKALAYCCGLERGIPVANMISQWDFRSGLDEKTFLRLAKQHKVVGTAYSGLKKAGLVLSPEGMRLMSREALIGRSTRSLILQDSQELAAAFKAQKIRMLVIKGPASSFQLYGDPLVREFNDLDVLADIHDLEKVLPLMVSLGYEPEPAAAPSPTGLGNSFVQKHFHHSNFKRPGRPYHVEIHGKTWQEDKDFSPVLIDAFFDRSVSLGDGTGWGDTLSPADQALFIIAHGTQHVWCLLHWLLDLAVILNRQDDTLHRAIADHVRALGMSRKLKLACSVVQSLYPVNIPRPLKAIIDEETALLTFSYRFAVAGLASGGKEGSSLRNIFLHQTVFLPSMTEDLSQKVRLMCRPFLPTQADMRILPLPRLLYFLYVPLRPVFVLARRWKRRFGRGDEHAV